MKSVYKYLIVIAVNVVCFYNSLSGSFVFDDNVVLLKNKDVYESEINLEVSYNLY
jgi:hypothetical protein